VTPDLTLERSQGIDIAKEVSDENLQQMLLFNTAEITGAKKRLASKKKKKKTGCEACSLGKGLDKTPFYSLDKLVPYKTIRESAEEKIVVIIVPRPFDSQEVLPFDQRDTMAELTTTTLTSATKIYMFPTVFCPHVKDPTKNMILFCNEHLRKAIVKAKPNVIICMGKPSCVPFGLEGPSKDIFNRIFEVNPIVIGEDHTEVCKLIATESPEKVISDQKAFKAAEAAFKQVNRQLLGDKDSMPDNYYLLETVEEFDKFVTAHTTEDRFKKLVHAFDIESNGRDIHPKDAFDLEHPAKLRCISFAWDIGCAVCVPIENDPEKYLPILNRFMTSDVKFIGHNVGFDYWFLRLVNNIVTKNIVGDTMNMAYLCGLGGYAGLKMLAATYTSLGGYETDMKGTPDEYSEDGHIIQTKWEQANMETMAPYNAADSDATLRIYKLFLAQIQKENMLPAHWIMTKSVITLGEMEHNGMHVNGEWVKSTKEYMEKLLERYKSELKTLANGHEYDWNSPQEMEHVLYDLLGYAVPILEEGVVQDDDGELYDGGHRPTGDVALAMINTPFSQALRKYRKCSKLLSTYFNGYLSNTDLDGCLRARYNITGTATGRLSSGGGKSAVNMQNIPSAMAPTDPGYEDLHEYKIKKAFIPRNPDWVMVNLDQSQLELRVAGALAKEPLFIESYESGIDLHSRNAKVSFLLQTPDKEFKEDLIKEGLKPGTKEFDIELTKKQCKYIKQHYPDRRQAAKTISFGVLYGMGPYGLHMTLGNDARNNGVPMQFNVDDCKSMINNFNKGYPTLAKWQTGQVRFARKNGYVVNPFGFRRYLPNIDNQNDFKEKAKDERRAKNTCVQGFGSQLMQCGIINMHDRLDPNRYKLVATVHDSVVCEVESTYVDEFIQIAKHCLEHPVLGNKELPICKVMPFVAETEVGPSYGELEEYKT